MKVSGAAIFRLVSDSVSNLEAGMQGLDKKMAVLETKQDQTHEQVLNLDKSLRSKTEKTDDKVEELEDEFVECQRTSTGDRGTNDERVKWLFRAIFLMITAIVVLTTILFTHLGLPVPLP